ncbi:hypothetical protein AMAG_11186 [Allomyces macrogynus ATCC 38327]|uniref:NADH dehydrogenase [ubiquinone] 1 alpha subcomplex subunit 13 n=1 Tax=Allomyces macrogynus (strain ATCC 38327) TaxID=578462 RepID=A0A0L0SW36_ALLM3|nr:hypothetical protein AMAG_11186 [Allomyces macrogynus ATCC 38327]|eukprot:KNE66686.1 hypothetical protein AMAG_11186 [Allomyces macrogynus ATCC 38327]
MSAPQQPYVQDMPPQGGFARVQYKRNIPARGPSGAALFAGLTALVAYGWYWNIQGIRERREIRREQTWARIHLVPMLQAEQDRHEARMLAQQEEIERKAMKDVPGWKVGEKVYHTDRYVPPTVLVADNKFLNLF